VKFHFHPILISSSPILRYQKNSKPYQVSGEVHSIPSPSHIIAAETILIIQEINMEMAKVVYAYGATTGIRGDWVRMVYKVSYNGNKIILEGKREDIGTSYKLSFTKDKPDVLEGSSQKERSILVYTRMKKIQ